MTEYLIAHCGRCGNTWALDFEPDGCTCGEYRPHVDDDLQGVPAADYAEARGYYISRLP